MLLLRTVNWTTDEVSEKTEDAENNMLLAMIEEHSKIEVSEIADDTRKLETMLELGTMLLLATTEVDKSEEVSTTLDEAKEDIWLSMLVLGRTDD